MSSKIKRTVDYTRIQLVAGLATLDFDKIDSYLREVAIEDFEEGKPILWACVIDPERKLPSENFFQLIVELKLVSQITDDNREQEHLKLVSAAFEYWSKRRRTGKRRY